MAQRILARTFWMFCLTLFCIGCKYDGKLAADEKFHRYFRYKNETRGYQIRNNTSHQDGQYRIEYDRSSVSGYHLRFDGVDSIGVSQSVQIAGY